MVLGSGIRDPRSGIRDPGSVIRKKPIPDPGSRGQKGTGSRIRIRNTGLYIKHGQKSILLVNMHGFAKCSISGYMWQ
jgi:hypothetical protein